MLIGAPSATIALKVGKDNIIKIKDKSPVKKELATNLNGFSRKNGAFGLIFCYDFFCPGKVKIFSISILLEIWVRTKWKNGNGAGMNSERNRVARGAYFTKKVCQPISRHTRMDAETRVKGSVKSYPFPNFPTFFRLSFPHAETIAGVSSGGCSPFHEFGCFRVVYQIEKIVFRAQPLIG